MNEVESRCLEASGVQRTREWTTTTREDDGVLVGIEGDRVQLEVGRFPQPGEYILGGARLQSFDCTPEEAEYLAALLIAAAHRARAAGQAAKLETVREFLTPGVRADSPTERSPGPAPGSASDA